jgi:uncharacterized membrane protein
MRPDVTVEEAAMACYSAVVMPLALYAIAVAIDVSTTKTLIRRNLQLVFDGIGARDSVRI